MPCAGLPIIWFGLDFSFLEAFTRRSRRGGRSRIGDAPHGDEDRSLLGTTQDSALELTEARNGAFAAGKAALQQSESPSWGEAEPYNLWQDAATQRQTSGHVSGADGQELWSIRSEAGHDNASARRASGEKNTAFPLRSAAVSVPGAPAGRKSRQWDGGDEAEAACSNRGSSSCRHGMQRSFGEKLWSLATPKIALFLFKSVLMGFGMGTFESYMCAHPFCNVSCGCMLCSSAAQLC